MTSAGEVEQAIKDLRQLHQSGVSSLKKNPGRMPYGGAQDAARDAQQSAEYLGKARKFASEKGGYGPSELEKLCTLMRQYNSAIGVGYLFKLLAVPKHRRDAIQTEALRNRWSVRELAAALATHFGNRRKAAGRKPHIPKNAKGVELALHRATQRWERVYATIRPADDAAGEEGRWRELTRSERDAAEIAHQAMEQLLELLAKRFPITK